MRYAALAAIFALAMGGAVLPAQRPALPELPQIDLKEFDPVVREQVQEAYGAARAKPRDANAAGRLGMLLDLYKRRELASICYKRAHALDPAAFRWLYYLGSLQSLQGKRADATITLRAALRLNPAYLPA